MIHGFVYSLLAVVGFLPGAIVWTALAGAGEEQLYLASGWILLICLFAVAPLGFVASYFNHRRIRPADPKWDCETGE